MKEYLSKKIAFHSLFLMILVILLHSQNISNRIPEFQNVSIYNRLIQTFFSGGICQVGVPFFFLISGYLYFGSPVFNIDLYIKKSKRRIKSLVIPFLLTSITVLLFFLVFQKIPLFSTLFNNKIKLRFDFKSLVDTFILYPQSYQLWFLRELIFVSFFLTPIIYLCIKYFKGYYIFFVLVIWLFFSKSIYQGIHPAVTFFSLGAYISINKLNVEFKINPFLLFIISILWSFLIFLHFLLKINNDLFLNLSILTGILVVWYSYDFFGLNSKLTNFSILSFSFFLYLFHEPVLSFVMKLIFKFLHRNLNVASFFAYLLTPLFTIFIVLQIGIQLKKRLSNVYEIYVGGR